ASGSRARSRGSLSNRLEAKPNVDIREKGRRRVYEHDPVAVPPNDDLFELAFTFALAPIAGAIPNHPAVALILHPHHLISVVNQHVAGTPDRAVGGDHVLTGLVSAGVMLLVILGLGIGDSGNRAKQDAGQECKAQERTAPSHAASAG